MSNAIAAQVPGLDSQRRGCVILPDPEILPSQRLQALLQKAGLVVHCPVGGEDLREAIAHAGVTPDLIVVAVDCSAPDSIERLRRLRLAPRARHSPILAVATFRHLGLDIGLLRSYGVVGLVDSLTTPEALAGRILEIVRPAELRRMAERVRCLFPIRVMREGTSAEEFAVDLSGTGMRITSRVRIDPNTDLELRFCLPVIENRIIQTSARVVHQSPKRNSWGRFEMGIFFYPVRPEDLQVIEREIDRLLAS